MRHGRDPACDLPVTDQRDKLGKIIVVQRSQAEPRGFDDNAGRFAIHYHWTSLADLSWNMTEGDPMTA